MKLRKLRCGAGIGESTMVVSELYIVELAEVAKAVRFVAGIPPPHASACAELRKSEPTLQSFVFGGDKSVVEVHIMRDKYPVAHELHERFRDFCEDRGVTHHVIGDAGELGDL